MDLISIKKLIELNTTEANEQLKEYLSDKNVYNISFPHGETMLHFAAGSNNADLCKYLIEEKGMIVDMYNSRSTVALTYATISNATEAIKVLLEHNADIRIRSGFSNLFPHQNAKTNQTMNMILRKDELIPVDYDNDYVLKDTYNHYQAYKYRYHRYFLQYVSIEFLKKNNIPMMQGMEVPDEYGITLQGFDNLLNQYKQIRNDWISSLTSSFEKPICLNCGNKSNVKRCSKCKSVYFCDKKCQKSAHLLHKFDCK